MAMAAAAERHGEHPLFVLEKGQITQAEFLERLEAELEDGHSMDGMLETYFGHLERNPEMIEYMRELRGRGLRAALLTNNVREWEPRWRPMLPEIDEIFEVVVDSAFVGMRKPEAEIYYLTVERLGGGLEACGLRVRGRHRDQLRRRARARDGGGGVRDHRAGPG